MANIAFDVNETLLSLEPMGPVLIEILGEPSPVAEWFARLLHTSLVVDHADRHEPFDRVAARALRRVAAGRGTELDEATIARVTEAMQRLPAHADVPDGLADLATAGHRLVAFSNGTPETLAAQLDHAGLQDSFHDVVSVEGSGRFKPHRRAYEHLCRRLDAFADEVVLVASHDWDVAGARAAGLVGIFLERTPGTWDLPLPKATTVHEVGDLLDVVQAP